MRKNKVIACIQARMGSKRLKGKALRRILGKTIIQIIFERLSSCKEIDDIVLATSTRKENDILAQHAQEMGLPHYRGDETDLISRHRETLKKFQGAACIRITADCPLVDPALVDRMVSMYRKNPNVDLISNVFPRSFPKGLDVEIIPLGTLNRLNKDVQDPSYRESLTCYMMDNSRLFNISNIKNRVDLSHLRWTLDYKEDLEFIRTVFDALGRKNLLFGMSEILGFLEQNPEAIKINQRWQNA